MRRGQDDVMSLANNERFTAGHTCSAGSLAPTPRPA